MSDTPLRLFGVFIHMPDYRHGCSPRLQVDLIAHHKAHVATEIDGRLFLQEYVELPDGDYDSSNIAIYDQKTWSRVEDMGPVKEC